MKPCACWPGKECVDADGAGNDMAGRMVLKSLRESGIKISDNCVREDIRTGINTVLVQEGGERSFLTDPGGSLRKLGPVASDISL